MNRVKFMVFRKIHEVIRKIHEILGLWLEENGGRLAVQIFHETTDSEFAELNDRVMQKVAEREASSDDDLKTIQAELTELTTQCVALETAIQKEIA